MPPRDENPIFYMKSCNASQADHKSEVMLVAMLPLGLPELAPVHGLPRRDQVVRRNVLIACESKTEIERPPPIDWWAIMEQASRDDPYRQQVLERLKRGTRLSPSQAFEVFADMIREGRDLIDFPHECLLRVRKQPERICFKRLVLQREVDDFLFVITGTRQLLKSVLLQSRLNQEALSHTPRGGEPLVDWELQQRNCCAALAQLAYLSTLNESEACDFLRGCLSYDSSEKDLHWAVEFVKAETELEPLRVPSHSWDDAIKELELLKHEAFQ